MASSIAQKAAINKAESILHQAVEKAEMAQEEAKAAERQAAEKAAHAVAHEEVSASQAEVSEQVCPSAPIFQSLLCNFRLLHVHRFALEYPRYRAVHYCFVRMDLRR